MGQRLHLTSATNYANTLVLDIDCRKASEAMYADSNLETLMVRNS